MGLLYHIFLKVLYGSNKWQKMLTIQTTLPNEFIRSAVDCWMTVFVYTNPIQVSHFPHYSQHTCKSINFDFIRPTNLFIKYLGFCATIQFTSQQSCWDFSLSHSLPVCGRNLISWKSICPRMQIKKPCVHTAQHLCAPIWWKTLIYCEIWYWLAKWFTLFKSRMETLLAHAQDHSSPLRVKIVIICHACNSVSPISLTERLFKTFGPNPFHKGSCAEPTFQS